jgi:hypothetical protein
MQERENHYLPVVRQFYAFSIKNAKELTEKLTLLTVDVKIFYHPIGHKTYKSIKVPLQSTG